MARKHLIAAKVLVITSIPLASAAHALGWHHGISLGLASEQSDIKLLSEQQTLTDLTDTSGKLLDNYSLQGYSINSNWAFSYQWNKHKTELTSISSKYQQQSWQLDVGISAYKFDFGLNIYPLVGVRHISSELLDINLSSTQAYAGVRVDVPIFRSLFAHVKADSNLGGDRIKNASIALNYRYSRNHSLMLEFQQNDLNMETTEQNVDYQLEKQATQIALRWFSIW